MEVLRTVLPLPIDSYATCGSRLLSMENTVMSEGLRAGRGGARMGGMGPCTMGIFGMWC